MGQDQSSQPTGERGLRSREGAEAGLGPPHPLKMWAQDHFSRHGLPWWGCYPRVRARGSHCPSPASEGGAPRPGLLGSLRLGISVLPFLLLLRSPPPWPYLWLSLLPRTPSLSSHHSKPTSSDLPICCSLGPFSGDPSPGRPLTGAESGPPSPTLAPL